MSMDGPLSSPSSQIDGPSSPANCLGDTEHNSNPTSVTPSQTDTQNTGDQTEQVSDPGGGSTSQTSVDNDSGSSVDKPTVFAPSPMSASADVPNVKVEGKGPQCFPQRGALLKSMLNFLKKAIPDPAFSDSIRHCKYTRENWYCNEMMLMYISAFLNKHQFSDVIIYFISVMEGSLPQSLKHIISNAEYYGPSLFLLGE